jgi:ribosomal protein S21
VSRSSADGCLVLVRGPADVEAAIRRFTKGVRAAGIFSELRRRVAYEPRSLRRRMKSKRAAKRRAQAARRAREYGADLDWKPERS